jgi:hypothetical protein
LDNWGVRVQVPEGTRIFTSQYCADSVWGPASLLSNGYWGVFTWRVKRLGNEADRSPPRPHMCSMCSAQLCKGATLSLLVTVTTLATFHIVPRWSTHPLTFNHFSITIVINHCI